MTNLTETCEGLSQLATWCWDRDHFVIPTLWATGPERSIFAQPRNSEAQNAALKYRAALHALMAAACDATLVGAIAEVFIKEQHEDEPPPQRGDLAAQSDTDPSIGTAIIVHGASVDMTEERLIISRLELADDGSPSWSRDGHDSARGVQHEAIHAVCMMLKDRKPGTVRDSVLTRIGSVLGWDIATTKEGA